MVKARIREDAKTALVVHPDLGLLAGLQSALTARGMRTIIARDLPTTLLAITQHYFDLAIIGSRIVEEGDGWPVAAVLRMVFPHAFLAVVAPETGVLTLQAAINSGINEVYESSKTPEELAGIVLAKVYGASRPARSTAVH